MQLKKQTTQNSAKQIGTVVQLPLTTLGQETRWAYSTTLPEPTQVARLR